MNSIDNTGKSLFFIQESPLVVLTFNTGEMFDHEMISCASMMNSIFSHESLDLLHRCMSSEI